MKKTKIYLVVSIILVIIFQLSCASTSLIDDGDEPEKYKVERILPEDTGNINPSFIVYGDSRPGWRVLEKFIMKKNWFTPKMLIFPFYQVYWLSNGLIGFVDLLRDKSDYGAVERKMVRDAMYEEAKERNIDFILSTGDLVLEGRKGDDWINFIEENKFESPLLNEYHFVPTIGSHEWADDIKTGKQNFESVFDYPPFFVEEFKNMDLFVVDSDLLLDQRDLIPDIVQDELFYEWFVTRDNSQTEAWLEGKLKSSDKKFKVLSMHHPPFSFGVHNIDWDKSGYGNKLKEKRKQFVTMLQKYNVQVVFTGHEHLYEHSILNYINKNNEPGKIHFIVTGGGGVPLRPRTSEKSLADMLTEYEKEGYDIDLSKHTSIHHYVYANVNNSSINLTVYETKKKSQKIKIDEIVINQ